MRERNKIREMTLLAFFIAIEIVFVLTPIGYLPIGALHITTMHIPVILAGIFLGTKYGAIVGFVFGLISMLRATFTPNLTSFVFSPFITVGGISGNATSLLIAFGPRIFLGWFSGKLFRLIRHRVGNIQACAISAVVNTMIHTILVLGMIYLFFGPSYAKALNVSTSAVLPLLLGVITSNGIFEAILAGIVVPAIDKALWPTIRRLRLGEE